jgi:hypothetical protein
MACHVNRTGWTTALACHLLAGTVASTAESQAPSRQALPELRIDASSGTVSSAQVGLGLRFPVGTYFRLAVIGAAGVAWDRHDRGHAARLELQGRFHLDPYRETRFGLYGIGGLAASHNPMAKFQARIVAGAGVELPTDDESAIAIEAALAGGVRLSLVWRRLSPTRR